MVQLSLFEEVKDRATRLIPTPYMEIVEEATVPTLHIPLYEHVMFLCESANTKPDALDDIVRALRRRMSDDNPAIKHLTVLLLDAMIKNCGPDFHAEVCAQKGLLRDLENTACNRPTSARGMQSKEAALTLILNLSIWFAGHPDPNCQILTTMAGDVRARSGPNAFDSVRSDGSVRIKMGTGTNRNRSRLEAKPDPRYRDPRSGAGHPAVVDAIPVDLPTENSVAQMLDTCVTFSEYVQNAELLDDGTVRPDDVIVGFEEKVRRDHAYVMLLLASDLPVDRDVLKSIRDSQMAVLRSLAEPRGGPQISSPTTAQQPAVSAAAPTTRSANSTSAADASKVLQSSTTPPKAATQSPTVECPVPTQPAPPAVDMDDLFGAPATAPAPAAVSVEAGRAPVIVEAAGVTAPTFVENDLFGKPPAPEDTSASLDQASPASIEADVDVQSNEVHSANEGSSDADARGGGECSSSHQQQPPEHAHPADKAAPVAPAVAASSTARATSVSNTVDDDDFDAFLEGRLSKP